MTLDQSHIVLQRFLSHVKQFILICRGIAIAAKPVIRNLYRRFHRTVLRSAISCQNLIKGKRRYLRNLVIRNYEPPKVPLHAELAG
jgi:hypothetical protein